MGQRIVGLGFALIGIGIIFLDTEVSLRCVAAPPAGLSCQAQRRILALIPLEQRSVPGVVAARVETATAAGTENRQQLVLRAASGDVRLDWFSRRTNPPPNTVFIELEPFDRVANDITQLAEHGAAGEVAAYRDIAWIPLLVGLGFLLFGILALWPW
jgi:hypothetical protein